MSSKRRIAEWGETCMIQVIFVLPAKEAAPTSPYDFLRREWRRPGADVSSQRLGQLEELESCGSHSICH
ncbi:MAG: hypothetical protein FD148_180 [Methylocystaceae bacterium]|nr:MAG: hypothetical protein FD148_180 [Methylocystaceae bacterium]